MALEGLGADFQSVACCESDDSCRQIIQMNFKTKRLFTDLCADARRMPTSDIFVAGPPCQPFSAENRGQGRGVQDPRADPFISAIEAIEHSAPKCFLLENVKGIRQGKNKAFFLMVMKALRDMEAGGQRYEVSFKTLDCKHFGLPQSRPRIWILGLRRDVVQTPFLWPRKMKPVSVVRFLDPWTSGVDMHGGLPPLSQKVARANVIEAIRMIRKNGHDETRATYIANIDGSKVHIMHNMSPCLTAKRMADGGHWIVSRGRRMTLQEGMRLQGIPPSRIKIGSVRRRRVAHMVGNGMSLPVLQAIFRQISKAAPSAFRFQRFGD